MSSVKHVFALIPTVNGIQPEVVSSLLFNGRTVLERTGRHLHFASLKRMPLDLVRAELVTTIFMSTTADVALCADDDCAIEPLTEPKGLLDMVAAIEGGCDIVSAPCLMRSDDADVMPLFNIIPITAPVEINGVRVVECAWTGFGIVMLSRKAIETVITKFSDELRFRSNVMPGREGVGVFRSMNIPARRLQVDAPADQQEYLLDDRAFSIRAIEAGLKIHAAIDITTNHRGLTGSFSSALERFERSRARQAAEGKTGRLVGADGRPV